MADLTRFLNDRPLVDLSWLDVDEEQYRAMDRLPRQNLDCVPDLIACWAHEDKPATAYMVPNTGKPRTTGDMSQVHGPLRTAPVDIVRTARILVMNTTNPQSIAAILRQQYDRESLRCARSELEPVFAEVGLLGKIYICAKDFPNCHRGLDLENIRRVASEAPYVVAKLRCASCIHAQNNNCAMFHKEIVVDIPYSEVLAEKVESLRQSKGFEVQAAVGTPRERIQRAFLARVADRKGLEAEKPVVDESHMLRSSDPIPAKIAAKPDLTGVRNTALKAVRDAFQTGRVGIARAREMFASVKNTEDANVLASIRKEAEASDAVDTKSYCGATPWTV